MALNIKDPETDRLARELAALSGESMTVAVRKALEARLAEFGEQRPGEEELVARMRRISRKCASNMDEPFSSLDHGELFYDEHGIPA